jgi:hypothetical protein
MTDELPAGTLESPLRVASSPLAMGAHRVDLRAPLRAHSRTLAWLRDRRSPVRAQRSVVCPDVGRVDPGQLVYVLSYAVFWKNSGIAFHGRLEFDPHGLWLHGGERGHELRVEIPYEEIVSVERDRHDKIGPCPAIRIQTRAASDLLIASSHGVGILGEIQDTLCHATHA